MTVFISTVLSVYNFIMRLVDRKSDKLKENRNLYYLPLSIQPAFSNKSLKILSSNGNFYFCNPLELTFYQGFVKTIRLIHTDLEGQFTLRRLSYSESEINHFFTKKVPYAEPQMFEPSIILPVFQNERILIDVHFLLIEGFGGDSELFMVFYAYDEDTKQILASDCFDKYFFISTKNQKIFVPEATEYQEKDIDYVLSLAFLDFKKLYKQLKEEIL